MFKGGAMSSTAFVVRFVVCWFTCRNCGDAFCHYRRRPWQLRHLVESVLHRRTQQDVAHGIWMHDRMAASQGVGAPACWALRVNATVALDAWRVTLHDVFVAHSFALPAHVAPPVAELLRARSFLPRSGAARLLLAAARTRLCTVVVQP